MIALAVRGEGVVVVLVVCCAVGRSSCPGGNEKLRVPCQRAFSGGLLAGEMMDVTLSCAILQLDNNNTHVGSSMLINREPLILLWRTLRKYVDSAKPPTIISAYMRQFNSMSERSVSDGMIFVPRMLQLDLGCPQHC